MEPLQSRKQSATRCTDLCCLRKCWHLVPVAAGQSQRAWTRRYSRPPTTPPPAPSSGEPPMGRRHSNGRACCRPWGNRSSTEFLGVSIAAKGRCPPQPNSRAAVYVYAHVRRGVLGSRCNQELLWHSGNDTQRGRRLLQMDKIRQTNDIDGLGDEDTDVGALGDVQRSS